MARTFHEMTREEQSAYRVWESRLNDRTLSESQHNEARLKLDELLWKTPAARVAELEKKVMKLQETLIFAMNENLRVVKELLAARFGVDAANLVKVAEIQDETLYAVVDFPAPTNPEPLDVPLVAPQRTHGPIAPGLGPVSDSRQPCEGLAPCGTFLVDPAPPHELTEKAEAEGKPGRGRPKGAKNKPKEAPVATGEGREQPATEIKEGEVTATSPAFSPDMAGVNPPASTVEQLFGF